MANHVSHFALPFPVKGCRFSVEVPYLDADGDPTDPTTPDTEVSKDAAAFADATEEVTTITGSNGWGYLTLTGDEMNASILLVAAKVASGPKNTLASIRPRVLPVIASGTAQAGAAGTITLAAGESGIDDLYIGSIIRTTGGTGGGGGSGSLNNQARVITNYVGSTKVATVEPNWETTPDATTTYEVLLTDNSFLRLADVIRIKGGEQSATDLKDFADDGYDPATNKVQGVVLVDTLTTYTGNTPQTGDSFARLGAPAGASVSADVAGVQSDTNDIQTRLPAALVGGRMDSSVGAMAAGVVTAAAVATDAIDGDAIAATAVTEIQAGLATAAALATVQADTDDIQTRLPAALVAGRMDSSVGAMATDTITSGAIAASAVTELQAGLATSASLATVQADTDDIQARLPAALVGGRIDASVGAMAANTLTASALAADAVNEIADGTLARALAAESYAADAGTPTLSQILWMIWSCTADFGIVGTTLSARKQDGTTAMTFTLDSATVPTTRTRTT